MSETHSSDFISKRSLPELTPPQERESRERVERLARWMDDGFRIPGTEIRFGWDSLLGLIPGIGDSLTTLIGLAILEEARRLGVPPSIRFRMVLNLLVDLLLGVIPIGGDLFDLFFRANRANAQLYLEFYENPRGALERAQQGNRRLLFGVILLSLGVFGGLLALFAWITGRL